MYVHVLLIKHVRTCTIVHNDKTCTCTIVHNDKTCTCTYINNEYM